MVSGNLEQSIPREVPPNTIADRYASPQMLHVFSPRNKVILQRDLWIGVMKAQAELGLDIPQSAIAAYEAVKNNVDLDSIRQREQRTKHDVLAQIEEFNALAGGHEYIHLGMTSRDLTDNIEQLQIKEGMQVIRDKTVAVLARMRDRALEHHALMIAARTHNVAAQPTLMGKRFAMFGEDMMIALKGLEQFIDGYPLRGIKGPVGTQADQLNLLKDPTKVAQLEQKTAEHLEFESVMGSVGQIYPRSLDFMAIAHLIQLSSGAINFSNMVRLMAGFGQAGEGFSEGQSGSSAMPHKMNARTSERIFGIGNILKGDLMMAVAALIGTQWNEGDVSDSSPRRVAIPDAFYAMDGLLEATLHVLDEMSVYPAMIKSELDRYMPFLTTTRTLMTAVQHGAGRETAHAAIKRHATAAVRRMQQEGSMETDLVSQLAQDPDLGLTEEQIRAAMQASSEELVGAAHQQIMQFAAQVDALTAKYPEAEKYTPAPLL